MGVNSAPDSPTNDVSARVRRTTSPPPQSNIVPAEQRNNEQNTTTQQLPHPTLPTLHPEILPARRRPHQYTLPHTHTPCANTSSTPKSPSARPAARSGSTAPSATKKKKTTPCCRPSRWSSSARSAKRPSARTRASSKTGAYPSHHTQFTIHNPPYTVHHTQSTIPIPPSPPHHPHPTPPPPPPQAQDVPTANVRFQRRILPPLRQPLRAGRADAQGESERGRRGRARRQPHDQGRAPAPEGVALHLRCRGGAA